MSKPDFDLATIKVTFEENQIRSLSRSMLPGRPEAVASESSLPSVEQVQQQLQAADVLDEISGIRMGYKMTYKISTAATPCLNRLGSSNGTGNGPRSIKLSEKRDKVSWIGVKQKHY
ncbi:hypothetical protein [Exiguobacterium antarcticum]|uniref:hypothetical protein n=1 Tax=Exiguobacterium antarcticum TaxID=132920 RepID=UPI001F3EA2C6|nr:hypothetical protein [Exiguobacterium antarcticum]